MSMLTPFFLSVVEQASADLEARKEVQTEAQTETQAEAEAKPDTSSASAESREQLKSRARKDLMTLSDQMESIIRNSTEYDDPFSIYFYVTDEYMKLFIFMSLWYAYRKLQEREKRLQRDAETREDDRTPAADRALATRYKIRTNDLRYTGFDGYGSYYKGEVCVEGDSHEGVEDSEDSGTTSEDDAEDDVDESPEPPAKKPKLAEKRHIEDKETGEIDIFADGYMVKGYFRRRWVYDRSEAKEFSPEERDDTKDKSWNSYNLLDENGSSTLVVEERRNTHQLDHTTGCRLSMKISSQLLLYRLTAVFGMAPASKRMYKYKQVWEATLYWKDDNNSKVTFFDYKGTASAQFSGNEDACKSSLKLLEFLLSDNVPHPYGFTLAGRAA